MVQDQVNPMLLNIFALSILLLGLKALFLGAATAATRGRIGKFINAEDAVWLGGNHVPSDDEAAARIGRAHRNDLENLLLFVLAGTIYLIAGGGEIAGSIYFGLFVISRIGHTFAYLGKRAALRRATYTTGFLLILLMSIHAALLLLGILGPSPMH